MRNNVKIGDLDVGDEAPIRLIAELGVNHLGDYGRMIEMIDAAIESGADLLKFQTQHLHNLIWVNQSFGFWNDVLLCPNQIKW